MAEAKKRAEEYEAELKRKAEEQFKLKELE